MSQSRTLKVAKRFAKDGLISAKDSDRLKALRLSDANIRIIGQQAEKHGDILDGFHSGNMHLWDEEAADALMMLKNSVLEEADQTIVTPGIGDVPLFMSREAGKSLGQFKSFAFAATNRVFLSGLQRHEMETLNGTILLITVGMMTSASKMIAAGNGDQLDEWSIGKWIREGISRSGVLGILDDALGTMDKLNMGPVRAAGLLDMDIGSGPTRYQSRNWMGALGGPTIDAVGNIGARAASVAGGTFSQSDAHKLRQLAPYQNHWAGRYAWDALEGGFNDMFGIPERANSK